MSYTAVATIFLENKKNKIVFSVMLICFYFILFSRTPTFTNADTATFGGDTWEYQSMGVNFAKGHGIQKWGGLEEFGMYKFDRVDSALVKDFYKDPGTSDFYRKPAYPL